jgi:hypothetical protein
VNPGSAVADRVRRRLAPAPPVLLFAQAGHVLGDMAVAAALAETLFFAVPVGEARLKVGLYLALAFAPYAVLSPLATRLLGRGLRAYGAAVVASDVGRALTCAVLVTRTDGPALYPLGFLILVLSRLHTVARHSLMPPLVPDRGNLLEANAAVSLVSAAAGIVGGGAALALARLVAPDAALVFAAAVFAFGSLSGLWLSPPVRRTGEAPPPPAWFGEGRLRRLVVALVCARAALGFTSMVIAFRFHSNGVAGLGVGLGALLVGTGLAPLAVRPVRRLFGRHLTVAALALLVVPAAVPFTLEGVGAAAALGGGVGFLVATARLGFDAAIQEQVGGDVIGRAYARYEAALQLGWVAGAAAATLLGVPLSLSGYGLAALGVGGSLAAWLLGWPAGSADSAALRRSPASRESSSSRTVSRP